MAKQSTTGKLTAIQVKQAKPKDKPYKLSDGAGMFLLVNTNESKYWRMKYRYNEKEKTLSLGVFPYVSLADARSLVHEARSNLAKGIDPNYIKRQNKINNSVNTFENIANEWHQKQSGRWSDNHSRRVIKTLKRDVFSSIGDLPIQNIGAQDILIVLRKIEDRGALDVASRVKQQISSIFNYAIYTGRAEINPADALKNVIQTRKIIHRASLSAKELPDFLKKLDSYQGRKLTQLALKLLILTFVRPGELRGARWEEINLEKTEWRIPAERMKMKEEHIVPLSSQAIDVISQIRELTGKYELMFPGQNDINKVMSENTLTYAIRKRLGFDATAHGFRSTASTILNEMEFNSDVIERQLAHAERNKIRAAYHHSQYLTDRKEMMQWWANYLDSQKNDHKVLILKSAVGY